MDLIEIKKELDYLRNEVNSLKIKDMQQYEKLMSVYSVKIEREEPEMVILKDKIFYLHKNIVTDELGFIKGKMENEIIWLSEDEDL
jgi:SMC interacting uncharacterized protein involved in chromosome segregation